VDLITFVDVIAFPAVLFSENGGVEAKFAHIRACTLSQLTIELRRSFVGCYDAIKIGGGERGVKLFFLLVFTSPNARFHEPLRTYRQSSPIGLGRTL